MVEVNFFGGAYRGVSPVANAQELINLYVEIDRVGGRTALIGLPGLTHLKSISSTASKVRALHVVGDYMYAIVGDEVYQIDASYNATLLNSTEKLATKSGHAHIVDILTDIIFCDGKGLWLYTPDDDTFTKLTEDDHGMIGGGSVTAQDLSFITHLNQSQQIYFSAAGSGSSWSASDVASGEAAGDYIKRVFSDRREMWIFKERTTEIWFNAQDSVTSATGLTFRRTPGGVLAVGLGAVGSVVSLDEFIYFFADDLTVRRGGNQKTEIVSTPNLTNRWLEYSTTDDAEAFGFRMAGHAFYQITFPTEDKTWIYDVSTGIWSERNGANRVGWSPYRTRHWANCYAFFNNTHVVGDYDTADIYEMDLDVYTDNGSSIYRRRTSQFVENGNRQIPYYSLKFLMESGIGVSSQVEVGQGGDPKLRLQWTDDGARTWSNFLEESYGKMGEYDKDTVFRMLGWSKRRAFAIETDEPVKFCLTGVFLNDE